MRYDNTNKFKKKEVASKEEKKPKEVKLKSEMYNHDNEKREEAENTKAIMWGFVLGFILFLILFIFIIVFVK